LLSSIDIERKKYETMFAGPWRGNPDPGMMYLDYFIRNFLQGNESIIDFGCGSGEQDLVLKCLGHHVALVDIAHNCLSSGAKMVFGDAFICSPVHQLGPMKRADWGYCTDLMEHIPEDLIDASLSHILGAAKNCFFSICTRPDYDGNIIGETLHVTVKPVEWWLDKIKKHWPDVKYTTSNAEDFVVIARSV